VTGIVPTNAYPTKDNKYVIIGGNGDSIYKRLMQTAGREELTGEAYATNKERVKHQTVIDGAISDWTHTLTADEIIEQLEGANVPCGKIYNIGDIVKDPHVQARGLVESVHVEHNSEGDSKEGWDVQVGHQ
jgi:crotonobetainyl-CoA:carnitine CoA-transferase CaiB-like acyl-CoA transferase